MSEPEPDERPPLDYASPRIEKREGWTTPRIFGGIFAALPGGFIVGLFAGGFACAGTQAMTDMPAVSFIVVLAVAIGLCALAYRTAFVARLFFLGATVGTAMICLLIGICGRLR